MAIDFLSGCEFKTQTEKYALNKTEYKKLFNSICTLKLLQMQPENGYRDHLYCHKWYTLIMLPMRKMHATI